MTQKAGDDAFTASLRALVATAVAQGPRDFADLLARLPGAWPPSVRKALEHMADSGALDNATSRRLQTNSPNLSHRDETRHAIKLPPPHPLDYDWRFDEQTVTDLLDRCVEATSPGDLIALLGTPSSLRGAIERRLGREFGLLDQNPVVTTQLANVAPGAVLCCDLGRGMLPPIRARLAIADPPWYPAHTRAFLWAAAKVVVPAGRVLLCQPTPMTRPGVLAERAADMVWAERVGLAVVGWSTGAVGYATPGFERHALAAAGLACAPQRWRRGDLLEFCRTRSSTTRRRPRISDPAWAEIAAGQARLRFRAEVNHGAGIDPRLVQIVHGDILPSVSRRHPLRARVMVWTASNRVFACRAPMVCAAITRALVAGRDVGAAVTDHIERDLHRTEVADVATTTRQLLELLEVEARGPDHRDEVA